MFPSINSIGQKIANFLGDNKDYGVSMMPSVRNYRVLSDVESMGALLPYEAYDESRGVFLNEGSIGFSLEFLPITGIDEASIEALSSLFSDELPSDGYLHVQLYATNKIGSRLHDFLKGRENSTEIERAQAKMRAEYFEEKTKRPVHPSGGAVLRDFRVYLHYSESHKDENLEFQIDEMVRMRSLWQTTLNRYMVSKILGVKELVAIMRELCAPSSKVHWPSCEISQYDSIGSQVASVASVCRPYPDRLEMDSIDETFVAQTFNCENLPNRFALWQMVESLGRTFESSQQVACPFMINLHVSGLSKEISQASIDSQYLANDKNANSPMAKIFPNIRKKQEELGLLREVLGKTGRMARAYLSVTTFSREGVAREVGAAAKNVFKSNGFEMQLDKELQFAGFLLSLPYLMSEGLCQDMNIFKRFKKITLFNAVNLMPILGDWKGNPKSTEPLYSSRRGQLMAMSMFDSPIGNYNGCISGDSGGGKSFAMQAQISDVLARGGSVYLLDIGSSSKRFVEMMGGTSIVVDDSLCINMFSDVRDYSESAEEVEAIISTMAHPSGGTTDLERSLISECAGLAFAKKQNEATISDVVEELKLKANRHREATDLIQLLKKFCCGGIYGKYFDGKTSVDLNNRFVEIDFEQVRKKEHLKAVLVMKMILLINEKFYDDKGERNLKAKLCVIDEAWDLLSNSLEAARFIAASYRRARKHEGGFLMIVQQLDALFDNAAGRTAYANSDYKFIFPQTSESVSKAIREKQLEISPYEERLVKSLVTTNHYSECFIQTKNVGSGVVRVIYEPFSRILHSSKKSHVIKVKSYQEEGASLVDAVARVASEEFPGE